jgi:D-arabinose 1-dehydrogenase-like Zn-dependent alcohol dehydrogenase
MRKKSNYFLTLIAQMNIKTKISQINKTVQKLVQAEINLRILVKIPFNPIPKKNPA